MNCGKRERWYGDECWTKPELHRHRHKGTLVMCKECRGLGYHPRNTRAYTCASCSQNYGSKMFSRKDLIKFIKSGQQTALYCRSCEKSQLACARCTKRFNREHWSFHVERTMGTMGPR